MKNTRFLILLLRNYDNEYSSKNQTEINTIIENVFTKLNQALEINNLENIKSAITESQNHLNEAMKKQILFKKEVEDIIRERYTLLFLESNILTIKKKIRI